MGEFTGKSDGTFRAPIRHTALGQTSFDKVHNIFSARPTIVEVENLWYTAHSRRPRLPSQNPDYKVVTNFSPEQAPYVVTALNYLNRLMLGEVYGDKVANPTPSLQERMMTDVTDNHPLSFQSVVKDAIQDVLVDFSDVYPNLTPALFYSLFGVGTQGIRSATMHTANYLDLVRDGKLSSGNIESVQLPKTDFAKAHPKDKPEGTDALYEIHCIGENVARTILDQSARAAIQIVTEGKDEGIDSSVIDKKEIEKDISFLAQDLLLRAEAENLS